MRESDLEPLPRIPEPHRGQEIPFLAIQRNQVMLAERLNAILLLLQERERHTEPDDEN